MTSDDGESTGCRKDFKRSSRSDDMNTVINQDRSGTEIETIMKSTSVVVLV